MLLQSLNLRLLRNVLKCYFFYNLSYKSVVLNKDSLGTVSEFKEFVPRHKSAKNWFQLSAGLNLEK